MWIADKETVQELNDAELFGLWIIDSPHVHLYREEAKRRHSDGNTGIAKVIEAAKKRLYEPPKKNGPDIRPLMDAALMRGIVSLEELCETIRKSSWDRRDPGRLMRKSPQEVEDILWDFILKKYWYKDLEKQDQKNLITMICHAYNRWRDQG